jgi:hypothetical protein
MNRYATVIIALSLSMSFSAFAQDTGLSSNNSSNTGSADVVSALGTQGAGIIGAINSLIAGYGKDQWQTQLNVATPFVGNNIAYGQGQGIVMTGNITGPVPANPNNKSGPSLTTQTLLSTLVSSPTTVRGFINAACAPASYTGDPLVVKASDKLCASDVTADTSKNFDASSLLTPLTYTDNGVAARSAIQFASGAVQSVDAVDFATVQKALNTAGDDNAIAYLLAIRSYAAAQSVGLSNLYQLYAERMKVQGLGKAAGLEGDANADASPLQVAEYAAKRRLTSKDWYQKMEQASPVSIQRETLYVLAEMRWELFQSRLATERLNAALSTLQLQTNASNAKFNLDNAKRNFMSSSQKGTGGGAGAGLPGIPQ